MNTVSKIGLRKAFKEHQVSGLNNVISRGRFALSSLSSGLGSASAFALATISAVGAEVAGCFSSKRKFQLRFLAKTLMTAGCSEAWNAVSLAVAVLKPVTGLGWSIKNDYRYESRGRYFMPPITRATPFNPYFRGI